MGRGRYDGFSVDLRDFVCMEPCRGLGLTVLPAATSYTAPVAPSSSGSRLVSPSDSRITVDPSVIANDVRILDSRIISDVSAPSFFGAHPLWPALQECNEISAYYGRTPPRVPTELPVSSGVVWGLKLPTSVPASVGPLLASKLTLQLNPKIEEITPYTNPDSLLISNQRGKRLSQMTTAEVNAVVDAQDDAPGSEKFAYRSLIRWWNCISIKAEYVQRIHTIIILLKVVRQWRQAIESSPGHWSGLGELINWTFNGPQYYRDETTSAPSVLGPLTFNFRVYDAIGSACSLTGNAWCANSKSANESTGAEIRQAVPIQVYIPPQPDLSIGTAAYNARMGRLAFSAAVLSASASDRLRAVYDTYSVSLDMDIPLSTFSESYTARLLPVENAIEAVEAHSSTVLEVMRAAEDASTKQPGEALPILNSLRTNLVNLDATIRAGESIRGLADGLRADTSGTKLRDYYLDIVRRIEAGHSEPTEYDSMVFKCMLWGFVGDKYTFDVHRSDAAATVIADVEARRDSMLGAITMAHDEIAAAIAQIDEYIVAVQSYSGGSKSGGIDTKTIVIGGSALVAAVILFSKFAK